ncbi:MAG: glycosyltransferase involved in cell wall biosynthesis [Lysobacterales bacterium]|jgi:glycosyltransferase involved in cell wall biosynthesis
MTAQLDTQPSVALIVSTYNQPAHLTRSLKALSLQDHKHFEIVIADDGSRPETQSVIEEFSSKSAQIVKHIWHEDDGFRKTTILNKAMLATEADYLIFIDGDILVRTDFIDQHLYFARRGRYLSGSIIRLNARTTARVTGSDIETGNVFKPGWLIKEERSFNRRFLRMMFSWEFRDKLNRKTTTAPHWYGSNSSCFRDDALAVNGFDNSFSYGYEDAEFGDRLELNGVEGRNVRWTAIAMHLDHGRPYVDPVTKAENYQRQMDSRARKSCITPNGLKELDETENIINGG